MKKPKKTLKDLTRLEAFLAKHISRSAKIMSKIKGEEAQANPVTAGYYERIGAAHAIARADHAEIVHLIETLKRKAEETQNAKAVRKATIGKTRAAKPTVKRPAPKKTARKSAVKKTAAKRLASSRRVKT
jgi:hypothetical protein